MVGRKPLLTRAQAEQLRRDRQAGRTLADLEAHYGICRSQVKRYISGVVKHHQQEKAAA